MVANTKSPSNLLSSSALPGSTMSCSHTEEKSASDPLLASTFLATRQLRTDRERELNRSISASKNKFVQLAIERVLFLAIEIKGVQHIRLVTTPGLDITIVGDNDFYSQRGQVGLLHRSSLRVSASLTLVPSLSDSSLH